MRDHLFAPAPAKLNLTLEVLRRREDGYHDIASVLQTLDLADTVTIDLAARAPGIGVGGPFASGTPADDSNLAWRAAAHLAAALDRSMESVAIHLDKHIPAAGGLGGGASDAATTLRLLQRAWPEATDALLHESAVAVGSDPAFFLLGGTARVQGRGERVTALAPMPAHDVVLFVPPATIEGKTAAMFAALTSHPFDSGAATAAFGQAVRRVRAEDVFNAFERVAFDLFPGLAELWERIEAAIGEPVRLAGAGPTLFWIGQPRAGAAIARRAEDLACTVIRTRTASSLWKP